MSALSNLKLVVAQKPTKIPPIVQRRNQVINKLWEQQKLAESKVSGTTYAPLKTKRVKDLEGNIKTLEVPKRLKPWWFTSDTGKTCLAIKYGNKPIEIAKGKSAIEVSDMKELVLVLSQLMQAINDGELDSQIDAASASVRAGFER
ncbi:MAG: hypothetical protein RIQ84_947 [Pseudomonadota bacterium]|jgi:hypothetical protein